MNTGLALTGRPDFLFQHFFPAHNAHLAVVDPAKRGVVRQLEGEPPVDFGEAGVAARKGIRPV